MSEGLQQIGEINGSILPAAQVEPSDFIASLDGETRVFDDGTVRFNYKGEAIALFNSENGVVKGMKAFALRDYDEYYSVENGDRSVVIFQETEVVVVVPDLDWIRWYSLRKGEERVQQGYSKYNPVPDHVLLAAESLS